VCITTPRVTQAAVGHVDIVALRRRGSCTIGTSKPPNRSAARTRTAGAFELATTPEPAHLGPFRRGTAERDRRSGAAGTCPGRHMRISKLRIGDGTAISRTSLTSGETILMWTPAGMVAAERPRRGCSVVPAVRSQARRPSSVASVAHQSRTPPNRRSTSR
jgi:hypothetical protein